MLRIERCQTRAPKKTSYLSLGYHGALLFQAAGSPDLTAVAISCSPHIRWVEVQVKAFGVNFRDVMTALGQISPYSLGCECFGVISAVGKSVK